MSVYFEFFKRVKVNYINEILMKIQINLKYSKSMICNVSNK